MLFELKLSSEYSQYVEPGTLYVVATPIGNLADFNARALSILAQVDLIAAEDTRTSLQLLSNFSLRPTLLALHDHNEDKQADTLIDKLQQGSTIALVSDAGTPLVSDPGYRLVSKAQKAGIKVVPVPGASAAIAALSALGLPSDRFVFEGFLPSKGAGRKQRLEKIVLQQTTAIIYEAPHRIKQLVNECIELLGEQQICGFAREITKQFETIKLIELGELRDWIEKDSNQARGEIVFVLPPIEQSDLGEASVERLQLMKLLLSELPATKAAKLAAKILNENKQDIYRQMLEM